MKATSKQVGGSHYISEYQPIEYIADQNLNFFQGNILKYVTRYRKKNGREDLQKAVQYCELAEELGPENNARFDADKVLRYVKANNLEQFPAMFLMTLCLGFYPQVRKHIQALIEKEYGQPT